MTARGPVKRIRIRMKATDAIGLARAFKSYLSKRGIFIKSGSMIPQGTKVVVELLYANGDRALYGEGQVAWARQDGPTGSGLNIELEWDAASQTLVDQIIAMPLLSKPPPAEKAPPPTGRRASTASRGIPPIAAPRSSSSPPPPRVAPPLDFNEPPTSPGLTPPPRRELDITDEASHPRAALNALRAAAMAPAISEGPFNEPLTDAAGLAPHDTMSMPPDLQDDLQDLSDDAIRLDSKPADAPAVSLDLPIDDAEQPQTEEDPAMIADSAPSEPPPVINLPFDDRPLDGSDQTQPMRARTEEGLVPDQPSLSPPKEAPPSGLFGWIRKKLGKT